jgi:hypothetical protein
VYFNIVISFTMRDNSVIVHGQPPAQMDLHK